MRGTRVAALAAGLLILAYLADRVHVAAVLNAGTYLHDGWAQELLLAADRLPKLVLLGALGWLLVRIRRSSPSLWACWSLVAIGVVVGVLPAAVASTFILSPLPWWLLDVIVPAGFVPFTAIALLWLGLAGLGRRFLSRGSVGPWRVAALAVALLALTWPMDAIFHDLFRGAASSIEGVQAMLGWELIGRFTVMAPLAVLAWRVDEHPAPSALAGTVVALAGAIVFAGFAAVALLSRPHLDLLPAIDVPASGWFARWASGGVLLVGLWSAWRATHSGTATAGEQVARRSTGTARSEPARARGSHRVSAKPRAHRPLRIGQAVRRY